MAIVPILHLRTSDENIKKAFKGKQDISICKLKLPIKTTYMSSLICDKCPILGITCSCYMSY